MSASPVDWLAVPGTPGRLGMMACPGGRFQGGGLAAGLRGDLQRLHADGARALVTLLPADEMRALGVTDIGEQAAAAGLAWLHLPIDDMCAPGEGFEIRWQAAGEGLAEALRAGQGVVLHCFAGLGRTGTVAARLLVDLGLPPPDAVRLVRGARPGAIQSPAQLRYVLALAR